jgi:hypothetical protein
MPSTEELKRLVERATPGEWKADLGGSIKIRHDDLAWLTLCPSMSSFGGYDAWPETKANAGLIALTPTLAAEVIASRTTIEALQARVEELEDALSGMLTSDCIEVLSRGTECFRDNDRSRAAIVAARAALAKVTP